ncbi:MAG: hypothetical protein GX879_04450 [Bacteroidales bacterium]|nr:hypothetical protein [Bacteroidales bacterium]
MIKVIKNYLGVKKLKKQLQTPLDPIQATVNLMEVGFTQRQAMAILNCISEMTRNK